MLKRIMIFVASVIIAAFALSFAVSAKTGIYVYDDAELFSQSEIETLDGKLEEVRELTGWIVAVATTNDIGGDKSDYAAIDYADMYFESCYGQDTDGVLYMINNDTRCDVISTSGVCIDYITDSRIDDIFDTIWDSMTEEKYSDAMHTFAVCVENNFYRGISSNQYGYDEYYYDDSGNIVFTGSSEMDLSGYIALFMPIIFFIAVLSLIACGVYSTVVKKYRLQSNVSALPYIVPSSAVLTKSTDSFVREYTTRTRVSSSSHRGGHSGGRSSSHRSSGGGRHGGGSRHR